MTLSVKESSDETDAGGDEVMKEADYQILWCPFSSPHLVTDTFLISEQEVMET